MTKKELLNEIEKTEADILANSSNPSYCLYREVVLNSLKNDLILLNLEEMSKKLIKLNTFITKYQEKKQNNGFLAKIAEFFTK